ncbi:MAG: tRNA uridine-5-carboxymethylaminomethyl(34) synthesis GTPase MnmE [Sphingomonas sp.]|nr:tRNA uridine-5-carboxymethylaminomethyl(34) synthesis GTPase MnmE [Sphingomonas sp.]
MADTIFALASGAPPAAIAIVRISGPSALAAAAMLAGDLPEPRRAGVRSLVHPLTGELLDKALVLIFPGPATATGEDLVELHLHGGRAVVAAVQAALGGIEGLRGAEPGEFSRRALMHGRIDLAEAEGLGDLLMAQTERQRRAAMASVEGRLSRSVAGWATELLMISAQIEASLDFSDEDDVGEDVDPKIASAIAGLATSIEAALAEPPVERLRDGVRVVLAGPRNAGKSTLLNALVGREAAIVSPIAGTTRDVIEVPVVRDGIAYVFADTAGLTESTDDVVEAMGISRARETAAAADIVLWLDDDPPVDARAAVWLYPRADERTACGDAVRLAVSAVTGYGLDSLWAALAQRALALLPREDIIAFNARQRSCCVECHAALVAARASVDPLLTAEHLRLARRALDRLLGRVDVEAMLDALFGRFCIGK